MEFTSRCSRRRKFCRCIGNRDVLARRKVSCLTAFLFCHAKLDLTDIIHNAARHGSNGNFSFFFQVPVVRFALHDKRAARNSATPNFKVWSHVLRSLYKKPCVSEPRVRVPCLQGPTKFCKHQQHPKAAARFVCSGRWVCLQPAAANATRTKHGII